MAEPEREPERERDEEVEAGPAAHGGAGEDEAIEGEGPAYRNEPRP